MIPTHPNHPKVEPDTGKPQLRLTYTGLNCGMQVFDARRKIQIVLFGEAPRGVRGALHIEGFTPRSKDIWDAPHSPMAIAAAQAIGSTFFSEDQS